MSMNRLRHQNYKNENLHENTQTIYLNNIRKNRILKVKNNLFEIEEVFKEFRHRELKDREIKIRRLAEELFFKPTIVFIDNIVKFKEKEMMKRRPFAKNTWCDWLTTKFLSP